MVQDVGFWEAVGLWCGGQKLEDFTMYGLPMLWWSRIGKGLQFLGGAVVVLDLIGPKWFQEAASSFAESRRKATESLFHTKRGYKQILALSIIGLVLFLTGLPIENDITLEEFLDWRDGVVVILASGMVLVSLAALIGPRVLGLTAFLVHLGSRGVTKWVAFGLVSIGFLLDLLGS